MLPTKVLVNGLLVAWLLYPPTLAKAQQDNGSGTTYNKTETKAAVKDTTDYESIADKFINGAKSDIKTGGKYDATKKLVHSDNYDISFDKLSSASYAFIGSKDGKTGLSIQKTKDGGFKTFVMQQGQNMIQVRIDGSQIFGQIENFVQNAK